MVCNAKQHGRLVSHDPYIPPSIPRAFTVCSSDLDLWCGARSMFEPATSQEQRMPEDGETANDPSTNLQKRKLLHTSGSLQARYAQRSLGPSEVLQERPTLVRFRIRESIPEISPHADS